MDYSLITPAILEKRFKSLPNHLQELATSDQIERLVTQIGKSHYLSRDKVELLTQLVGLTLLGLLNLRDLKGEISEKLFLNYAHTVALAHELDEEIFNPVRGDLEQVYASPEEDIAREEVGEPEKPIQEIEPLAEESVLPAADLEAPVMIHREIPSVSADPNRATKFADLSKSFTFFRKKEEEAVPGVARVETGIKAAKPEEKVVHYNELKTPVAEPFGGPDFINLEAFDAPHPAPSVNVPTTPSIVAPGEKVVLQGNHVDLRPKTI